MTAPPRRLSVFDADYDPDIGRRVHVSLDSVVQTMVEAYDVDAGTVTRPKLDPDGYIYVVDDEIARETVTGNVEVSWNA
jgi:hypothetical protein